MSLFRRRPVDPTPAEEPDDLVTTDDTEDPAPAPAPSKRDRGPWDISEVDDAERLDLGAIRLSPVPGLELRLEIDQQNDTISGIQLVVGESAAQVQSFAAPRSGGLWAEIREELATSIGGAGGTVEEVDGEFGPELRVRLPQVGPDGRTVFAPARFIGVDGPRWFVRAVVSGRAAVDPDGDKGVIEAFRNVVVDRGNSPMAPRELLPLRLPDEAAVDAPEQPPAAPDLNPFERGPEITEVR